MLRVLVPVDFSAHSLRALDQVLAWSTQAEIEVHVAHIVDRDGRGADTGPELLHDYLELERFAEHELRRVAPASSLAVQRHVRSGAAAAAIVELAGKLGVDLIVIGTHGRSGLGAMLLGSVARQVVRLASCPVMCVRPAARAPARPCRRIVCALDFSEGSRRAMDVAVDLGGTLGAELVLVHATLDAPAAAARALDDWKLQAEARGGRPVATAVVSGAAARAILDFARAQDCDLLVIGSHGRTGVISLLMGSVAEAVLRAAPCPVVPARLARPTP
jgi:nucleotide-binding universal stress UspA family protein